MSGLRNDIDPDGLWEYSVVFTDRSLNHMSATFQQVMRDIHDILCEVYGADTAVVVPGGGTFAMEAVARQFVTAKSALVIRNGWFSYRWSQIFEAGSMVRDEIVLKARRAGKILFVTSATPLRGLPGYSMYVTARGAANALAVTLAKELARDNIQVNAVAPNYVESPDYFPAELLDDPKTRDKILANIPLGRLGKPEELAALIAFLASGKADFITGQVIPFAGGWA